jgi:hypothetical protein
MTTINLITAPDKLFNDGYSFLLIYPSDALMHDLQDMIFNNTDQDINVYVYSDNEYIPSNVDWMLSVFQSVDTVIIDLDNCESFIKDILALLIAKPKTYWLTKGDNRMYNHISKNKIYTLDYINNIGDLIVKRPIQE